MASISPQARASLAARFGLTPLETQERLLTFLRGIGVGYLIDSSLAVDFSLLEAGEEFVQRYRRVSEEGIGPLWAAPSPTVALSSTRRFNVEAGVEEGVSNGLAQAGNVDGGGGGGGRVAGAAVGSGLAVDGRSRGDGSRGPGELLVITSACPGWVCYAEKTAPEALPCMSTVKSPQQVSSFLRVCCLWFFTAEQRVAILFGRGRDVFVGVSVFARNSPLDPYLQNTDG